MKNCFLLLLILVSAMKMTARTTDLAHKSIMFREYTPANDSINKAIVAANMAKAHCMKTRGAILTGVGAGVFLVGDALTFAGLGQNIATDGANSGYKLAYPGYGLIAAGLAMLIPGVVMLVKGNKRYKRLRMSRVSSEYKGVIIN